MTSPLQSLLLNFILRVYLVLNIFVLLVSARDDFIITCVSDFNDDYFAQAPPTTDMFQNLAFTRMGDLYDVTYDPVDDRLYWIENIASFPCLSTLNIVAADFDGSNRQSVVSDIDCFPAKGSIEIDIHNRYLFWLGREDGGSNYELYRSKLDGTDTTSIGTGGSQGSGAISFDPVERNMYWTHSKPTQVQKINTVNGTTTNIMGSEMGASGVAVDIEGRKLILTGTGGSGNLIQIADLDGGNRSTLASLSGSGDAEDPFVYRDRIYYIRELGINNGIYTMPKSGNESPSLLDFSPSVMCLHGHSDPPRTTTVRATTTTIRELVTTERIPEVTDRSTAASPTTPQTESQTTLNTNVEVVPTSQAVPTSLAVPTSQAVTVYQTNAMATSALPIVPTLGVIEIAIIASSVGVLIVGVIIIVAIVVLLKRRGNPKKTALDGMPLDNVQVDPPAQTIDHRVEPSTTKTVANESNTNPEVPDGGASESNDRPDTPTTTTVANESNTNPEVADGGASESNDRPDTPATAATTAITYSTFVNVRNNNPIEDGGGGETNAVNPVFAEYEIERTKLEIKEELGNGAYGVVYRALYIQGQEQTLVAAKGLKDNTLTETKEIFLTEIQLIIGIQEKGMCPNILGLIGCVTESQPYYLLTEFMKYGDLQQFLVKCKQAQFRAQDDIYHLTATKELEIARQIANGMAFLSDTRYYHGDLAARNVLVGEGLIVKIADFGMARDLYAKGYARLSDESVRPLKWVSLETNLEGRSTIMSDVWSFGIVLYEIATHGEVPYPGMTGHEVVRELRDGYRMEKPKNCHEKVYDVMRSCWAEVPTERPTFKNLLRTIDEIMPVLGHQTAPEDNGGYINARVADAHHAAGRGRVANTPAP